MLTGEDFRESIPEQKPTPSESLQSAERGGKAVHNAVGELPEDLRASLILSEYQGLSHAEVAKFLECSAKVVETRLYRARNLLRNKFSSLLDGPSSWRKS